jgi:hypothetical protein
VNRPAAKGNLWRQPLVLPSLKRAVVAAVEDTANAPVAAAVPGVAAGPGAVEAVATGSEDCAFAWAPLGHIGR